MRGFLTTIVCAIMISSLFGCGSQQSSKPDVPNLLPHIMAALKTPGKKERDQAVAVACREAADEKAWPAVMAGVQHIEDKTLRDQVADECAHKLKELGKTDGAQEVAKLILDASRKDTVLKDLRG